MWGINILNDNEWGSVVCFRLEIYKWSNLGPKTSNGQKSFRIQKFRLVGVIGFLFGAFT